MTIKVWTSGSEAGLLDKARAKGSTFSYERDVAPENAISLTMPVRLESWNMGYGLAPIFEMNLPEGALLERLRLAFAKATGSFDDLDLLAIIGRSQVGRIRYTGETDILDEEVPFQSVDDILNSQRDGDLFQYLIEKFAAYSGVSGVQPKLMVRDVDAWDNSATADRASIQGATHIVKFWDNEYPELAANEYFCLLAAQRCGLELPRFQLSDNGRALVVDRFDLRIDGTYKGFEDFCVLNGRQTREKYAGSYETAILKRFRDYASPSSVAEGSEQIFTLIALNCALRNGDAHLKNFGIVYDDIISEVRLAPVYDVVTTTVYIPQDSMALTLNGSTRWPTTKQLQSFGETRQIGGPSQIKEILSKIAGAMTETMDDIETYRRENPNFSDIGSRMMAVWNEGIEETLKQ